MPATSEAKNNLNQTGQNLVRVLIASYFVAVSIGLISGTGGIPLASQLMAEPFATYVGNAVVFSLAYLVMMGIWLRPAALLLALTIFWSSYLVNFSTGGAQAMGDFWRDLALIGALFLTYTQSGPRAVTRRAMLRWSPRVRRLKPQEPVAPRRVVANTPVRAKITPIGPRIAARDAEPAVENIFADDFDFAVA